jgi:hypothetical protein
VRLAPQNVLGRVPYDGYAPPARAFDKPVDFPAGFVFSAVVIQEMMASAADNSELKRWAAAWVAYEKEDRLIVPTSADWLMASKVLYWLMQKRKKKAGASRRL